MATDFIPLLCKGCVSFNFNRLSEFISDLNSLFLNRLIFLASVNCASSVQFVVGLVTMRWMASSKSSEFVTSTKIGFYQQLLEIIAELNKSINIELKLLE